MSNLFSRLYKYRQLASLSPMENFLTEALVDTFNRMPSDLKMSFVKAILARGSLPALESIVSQHGEISALTQVEIETEGSSKRPDIVIYSGHLPIVVIEVKIGAEIQIHEMHEIGSNGDGQIIQRNQLETYVSWMQAESPSTSWPGAVVFLSAFTEPPLDFVAAKGIVFRSTFSWKNIADWILDSINVSRRDVTHCALAGELLKFIKEEKLMSNHLSSKDISAATLFMSSHDSLRHTFRDVAAAIVRRFPRIKGGRQTKIEFWSEFNSYIGWFYINKNLKPAKSKPWLAVGLCTEMLGDYPEDIARLPKYEPFFFVAFEDDWRSKKAVELLSKVPIDWIEIEEGWRIIIARPVRDFSSDPDVRAEELKAWSLEMIERLTSCIPGFHDAPFEPTQEDDEG